MAFDLIRRRQTPRDWSLGGEAPFAERRVSTHEQAKRQDLAAIPREFLKAPDSGLALERSTLSAYGRLKRAAGAAGFPYPIFQIVSGFRTLHDQEFLWVRALGKYGSPEKARIWVAPPGHSTHATGRAVDLWLGLPCTSENAPALRATRAYAWLVAHAAEFGFYPYLAEPWHWEYNPTPVEAAEARLPLPAVGVPMPVPGELMPASKKSSALSPWTAVAASLAVVGLGGWYLSRAAAKGTAVHRSSLSGA